MSADLLIACTLALVAGTAAAYFDVAGFFQRKRISTVAVLGHLPCSSFLAANGAVAGGVAWWLTTPSGAEVAKAVGATSPWSLGLAVGLGFPTLIRSKLFVWSSDKGPIPVGPELLYEKARDYVLHSVHRRSILEKQALANCLAKELTSVIDAVDQLHDAVLAEAKPFVSAEELKELETEFSKYQERFARTLGTAPHLRSVLLWAMDSTSIAYIARRAESILESQPTPASASSAASAESASTMS